MAPEDRKHAALIVGAEIEEAVPGQHAIELHAERKLAHVADAPIPL